MISEKKLKKVRLKGNESFNFREGWLRKGMRSVENCETLFSRDDVMEQLGVGSKMVKSIRFWLQASALCEEKYTNSGRSRAQHLTEDFGRVVLKYDPYFDDIFTLFLIHYQIVSNEELCIVWNIFFNEYEGQDFSKDGMITACQMFLDKKMDAGCSYSDSSFEHDCSSIIRMYMNEDAGIEYRAQSELRRGSNEIHPEDSLACPFVDLKLLHKSSRIKGAYIKTIPVHGELDKLAVFYVITKNLLKKDKTSVSIDDLLRAPNNIGRVFNLNRIAINEYLDQLRISGYLTINRTAGLDMVYVDSIIKPQDIMAEYYEKAQGQ